jgi:hypothetical protein
MRIAPLGRFGGQERRVDRIERLLCSSARVHHPGFHCWPVVGDGNFEIGDDSAAEGGSRFLADALRQPIYVLRGAGLLRDIGLGIAELPPYDNDGEASKTA